MQILTINDRLIEGDKVCLRYNNIWVKDYDATCNAFQICPVGPNGEPWDNIPIIYPGAAKPFETKANKKIDYPSEFDFSEKRDQYTGHLYHHETSDGGRYVIKLPEEYTETGKYFLWPINNIASKVGVLTRYQEPTLTEHQPAETWIGKTIEGRKFRGYVGRMFVKKEDEDIQYYRSIIGGGKSLDITYHATIVVNTENGIPWWVPFVHLKLSMYV